MGSVRFIEMCMIRLAGSSIRGSGSASALLLVQSSSLWFMQHYHDSIILLAIVRQQAITVMGFHFVQMHKSVFIPCQLTIPSS